MYWEKNKLLTNTLANTKIEMYGDRNRNTS